MAEYTIDKIEYGGNVYKLQDNQSGYITSYTETDPVFSASAAAGITATDITNWNSKTSNTGTVTSINLISGTGITVSNSNTAITTSGSRTITLNTIKTSKSSSGLGGAQVWKSWESGASITPPTTIGSYTGTFTVQNSTTIVNRYYPVEATYDGHLIVNIPWESVPTNISAFTNDSGYLTSYTETDPVFSASAAAGITSSDITSWNNKVSDTGQWNGVSLNKQSQKANGEYYIPYLTNVSTDDTASLVKVTYLPENNCLPKYDADACLKSATPSANDNSTKVATTAYVDAAIPDTSNFLTLATLPIYDGTVE